MKKTYLITGLILNLAGSIFLAFSLEIINLCEIASYCMIVDEIEQTILSINKNLFLIGIIFLIAGFIIQLIAVFIKKDN